MRPAIEGRTVVEPGDYLVWPVFPDRPGFYRPDSGRIALAGEDVTALPPHRIARLGVGWTFQIPMVPEELTVLEVVMSGRYHLTRLTMLESILRLPRHWRRCSSCSKSRSVLTNSGGIRHCFCS